MRIEKTELTRELLENNLKRRQNKYTNNLLVAMLEKVPNGTTLEVNLSRGGFYDRGSIAEVLAKMIINLIDSGVCEGSRSNARECDMDTTQLSKETRERLGLPKTQNLEIKLATNSARGSKKTNNAVWTLVINEWGAYLVRSTELNRSDDKHILPKQPKGQRLDYLSELLGY